MENSFDFLYGTVILVALGILVAVIVKGIGQWNKNNHSPRLTVESTVAGKRMEITHRQYTNAGDATGAHGYHTTTTTWYCVESGDRLELRRNKREYDSLTEGALESSPFREPAISGLNGSTPKVSTRMARVAALLLHFRYLLAWVIGNSRHYLVLGV